MESIIRLVDSHCDQRQMLKGIVESFVILDCSWWGREVEREQGEEQSKYVEYCYHMAICTNCMTQISNCNRECRRY